MVRSVFGVKPLASVSPLIRLIRTIYFVSGDAVLVPIKPDGRIGVKSASSDTKYMVLINYIKGETDAKGFTPKNNRTILVDGDGNRTTVYDYRNLEVLNV